jgi:hypothetical protein
MNGGVRIINLILFSRSEQYDQMRDILRGYLKNCGVKYFFYCYDETISADYKIDGDYLLIRGKESFVPGIFAKTVSAFEIVMQFEFDYLVRSNISTVVDFHQLEQYLKNNPSAKYTGSKILAIKWKDPACGIYDDRYNGERYIAGTGITLSREMVHLIVNNQNKINLSVIDDLGIGLFYKQFNIFPEGLRFPRAHVMNSNKYYVGTMFYRNKSPDRNQDIANMRCVVEQMIAHYRSNGSVLKDRKNRYNQMCHKIGVGSHSHKQIFVRRGRKMVELKKQPKPKKYISNRMMYAYYGTPDEYIDVIDIIVNQLYSDNKITVPKSLQFNDIFGDPVEGIEKILKMQFNGQIFVLNEWRDEDFVLDNIIF